MPHILPFIIVPFHHPQPPLSISSSQSCGLRNIIPYSIIPPWTAVAVPLLRLDTHPPGGFGGRALTDLQFLDEFGRIPPERMHLTAWADLKPVSDNDTFECRQQNRRASIVVLYPNLQQAEGSESINDGFLSP